MALEPSAPEIADARLLARMAEGDLEAFGEFYDRFAAVLYSLAMKILRNSHEAEEVLQDAMMLIWERAAWYDAAAGKPLSWAITITRNKAIDRVRSTQRKTRLLQDAALELDAGPRGAGDSADRRVLEGEASALVRGALITLPRQQRHAIELAFFAGLTQSQIAVQLGEPLGTIKARIRRGMLTLRDALAGKL